MEHLIRFKARIQLLSRCEFITFIQSQQQQILVNVVFNSFLQDFMHMHDISFYEKNNLQIIKHMRSTIDNIIRDRVNHEHQQHFNNNTIDINQLNKGCQQSLVSL